MSEADKIRLFIPCLIDQVYPEMGKALVRILRRLGYSLVYDAGQVCCGQPAYNAGHWDEARQVAREWLRHFSGDQTVVCPSGSCTAMVRREYLNLFKDEPGEALAQQVGAQLFEFTEWLVQSGAIERLDAVYEGVVGLHHSCHSYRELGLEQEPLAVLGRIRGLEVRVPPGEPECCGFGGLFSVKFPAVSSAMAWTRLEHFLALGVDTVVINDPGCIMHLRQEVKARNLSLRILHIVELLDVAMTAAAEESRIDSGPIT